MHIHIHINTYIHQLPLPPAPQFLLLKTQSYKKTILVSFHYLGMYLVGMYKKPANHTIESRHHIYPSIHSFSAHPFIHQFMHL